MTTEVDPKNISNRIIFKKLVEYFHQHEDEQIAIKNIVNGNLRDHCGDYIIITDIFEKYSVFTLRKTEKSILQTFYNRPKMKTPRLKRGPS